MCTRANLCRECMLQPVTVHRVSMPERFTHERRINMNYLEQRPGLYQ